MAEEQKQKWRFTFGDNHAHPGYCLPIIGTFNSAREKMFELYGDQWCMQYSEERWEEIKNDPNRFWEMEKDLEVIEV